MFALIKRNGKTISGLRVTHEGKVRNITLIQGYTQPVSQKVMAPLRLGHQLEIAVSFDDGRRCTGVWEVSLRGDKLTLVGEDIQCQP